MPKTLPRKKEQTWPEEIRKQALFDLYISSINGKPRFKYITQLTQIPTTTLARWWNHEVEGITQLLSEQDKQDAELLRGNDWVERKAGWIDRVGRITDGVFDKMDAELGNDDGCKPRDLKDLAITSGVMMDKSFALAGDTTNRHAVDVNVKGRVEHKHIAVLPPKEISPQIFTDIEVVETE